MYQNYFLTLLPLMIIQKQDKTIEKIIRKRIEKIKRGSPNTFKKLLPPPKKGFRKKTM